MNTDIKTSGPQHAFPLDPLSEFRTQPLAPSAEVSAMSMKFLISGPDEFIPNSHPVIIAAHQALARFGGEEAFDAIVKNYRSSANFYRFSAFFDQAEESLSAITAITALGLRGYGEQAIAALLKLAQDEKFILLVSDDLAFIYDRSPMFKIIEALSALGYDWESHPDTIPGMLKDGISLTTVTWVKNWAARIGGPSKVPEFSEEVITSGSRYAEITGMIKETQKHRLNDTFTVAAKASSAELDRDILATLGRLKNV